MSNKNQLTAILAGGLVALIAEFGFGRPMIAVGIIFILAFFTLISMGKEMIDTLRQGRYGVDILAITSIIATIAVKEHWATLIIMIMLVGGETLEDFAENRASRELRALLAESPEIAHRETADGAIEDIKAEEAEVGDILLVKPQEKVPVDGIVLEGQTQVDESSLTGESVPVSKAEGDEVMSGSVNGNVSIRIRVAKPASDSQYQRLVRLVKESESQPAEFVKLADRYSLPFTIISYIIAFAAWGISRDPVRFAQVLVVASPCPLILSAPIAMIGGMSRSSRHGIVVKSGTSLEIMDQAKSIAFDKTGTLTAGQLQVEDVIPAEGSNWTKEELLLDAASVEQESAHVLARSLVAFAKAQGLTPKEVDDLEEIAGEGVQGTVDGQFVKVGKASFVGLDQAPDFDRTLVHVAIGGQWAGTITFADTVRPESKATVEDLRNMGVSNSIMLTGDKQSIADRIAGQVGITEVHAHCLPEEKINVIKGLTSDQRPVIMVGDGINDAPALATADVGIAMGAHGSTAASETADAVILKDDISKVSDAVRISKDTMKIAKEAVILGIGLSIVLELIAATGVIPATLGAVLQEVADLCSIGWALRSHSDR